MPTTTWKINVGIKGSRGAKQLARDLRDLDAVCVALGKSSGVLKNIASDAGAIRGARVRVRAERAVGDETVRQQRRSAAAFDANGNVRRAVVRRQERDQREAARAQERDDNERRSIGEGIARAAAKEEAREARERTRAKAQRRRDDEGIARASRQADRDDAQASQRAHRNMWAAAKDADRIATGRARDRERATSKAERDMHAAAREGNRLANQSRRERETGERQAARVGAERARAQARAERGTRASRAGMLSELGAVAVGTLGIITGIVGATIGAASAIADLVGGVGQLVFTLGSAVLEMIAFREASLTTLRAMARDDAGHHLTGDAADRQAHQRLRFAQTFARQTPLDTAEVIDLQRQTSAAGFVGQRNEDVVKAAADVGAFNPNDAGASRRFLLGLGQLRNASSVRTQDVRQTAEAAGLGENDILREIARNAGQTQRRGETDASYNGRIQGMQRGGRFTGAQGVEGVLAALQSRNGGALGSFAQQQGGTLTGTLSNLRGAVLDFVTSIDDIENLPGVRALKSTLNSVVDALTGTGPLAQRLQRTFSTIVDDASQLFADLAGNHGGVEGIFTRLLDTAERIYPVVRDITVAFGGAAWEGFRDGVAPLLGDLAEMGDDPHGTVEYFRALGKSFGDLLAFGVRFTAGLTAIASALVPILDMLSRLADLIAALPGVGGGAAVGAAVGDGFRLGFARTAPAAVDDVRNWSQDLATTSEDELMVQSPSRVFRDIGRQIPAGMSLGIDSGARDVERSLSSMVAPPSLGAFGAAGMGGFGMGGISAVFNITVEAGEHANDTGQEIGDAAWSQFVDRFEGAMAMGGS